MFTEIKWILFSICLLLATGNGNVVYLVIAAFIGASVSYFYKLFIKD